MLTGEIGLIGRCQNTRGAAIRFGIQSTVTPVRVRVSVCERESVLVCDLVWVAERGCVRFSDETQMARTKEYAKSKQGLSPAIVTGTLRYTALLYSMHKCPSK